MGKGVGDSTSTIFDCAERWNHMQDLIAEHRIYNLFEAGSSKLLAETPFGRVSEQLAAHGPEKQLPRYFYLEDDPEGGFGAAFFSDDLSELLEYLDTARQDQRMEEKETMGSEEEISGAVPVMIYDLDLGKAVVEVG